MIFNTKKPYHQKKSPPDEQLTLPRSTLLEYKTTDSVILKLNAVLKAHKPEKDYSLRG